MKPRSFTLLISATVIVVAFILLFVPVKATTPGGSTVGCGNGFSTNMSQAAHDSNVNDLSNAMLRDSGYSSLASSNNLQGYAAACADALSTRRTWGFGLLGLSAVVFLGALVVRQNPGRPTSAPATE